jgi:hypothetical protein
VAHQHLEKKSRPQTRPSRQIGPLGRLPIHATSFSRTLLSSRTTPTTAFRVQKLQISTVGRPPDTEQASTLASQLQKHLLLQGRNAACPRGSPVSGPTNHTAGGPPKSPRRRLNSQNQKLAQHAPRFPPAARARARRRCTDTVGPPPGPACPAVTPHNHRSGRRNCCRFTDMWGYMAERTFGPTHRLLGLLPGRQRASPTNHHDAKNRAGKRLRARAPNPKTSSSPPRKKKILYPRRIIAPRIFRAGKAFKSPPKPYPLSSSTAPF